MRLEELKLVLLGTSVVELPQASNLEPGEPDRSRLMLKEAPPGEERREQLLRLLKSLGWVVILAMRGGPNGCYQRRAVIEFLSVLLSSV